MNVTLDLNTVDGYRTFLKVKSLPVYKFTGRTAWFPDEYSERVGVTDPDATATATYTPHTGLFDYQRGIAEVAIRRRKFAVFMEPGMGKTLIDFEFGHHAAEDTGGRVLIVCPLMVVRQMIEEHRRFYPAMPAPDRIQAAGLQAWLDAAGPGFGITNYEAIRDGLTPGNLSALILSESSMLKSHYGKFGQRLIRLGKGLRWKLCETGTPAPNDRIEYANHAVFLDQFPTVNSFLAKFFVNRGETNERWELKPHALRPFYRALSHWSVFLTNPAVYGWKDNCATLPRIETHIEDVDLTGEQRAAAQAAGGDLFGSVGGIASRATMARIAKGFGKNGKRLKSHKLEYVADRVRGFAGEQAIVWCKYNPEQDELRKLLPDAGNVAGDTKQDERERVIAGFQDGSIRNVLTKPRVMGFGLNLQAATRQVFSTLQDSYEEYYQAVKRSNRYGSTRPLHVHIPVTDLERPMVETVLRKAKRVQEDTEEQERLFREVGGCF